MRILIITMLVAAFAMTAGCGASAEKKEMARSHFMFGQSQLRSGNVQQAYIKFHEALEYNPRDKEVHHALGYVNMKNKEYAKALEHLRKAVKIDSGYSEAWNTMCVLNHMHMKDYNGAIVACEKALKNDKYSTPEKSMYALGRIYYKLGDYNKSLEYFSKVVIRFPSLIVPYYGQALVYNALGRRTEASEAISTAIGLDPVLQGDKIKAEKFIKKNRNNEAYFETPDEADRLIEILHY